MKYCFNFVDRECPEPEQIAFGVVTASGKLFGARATYSCQHGYHVVGLQSRTCQADGKWAGTPPACKQNSKTLNVVIPNKLTFVFSFSLLFGTTDYRSC